MISPPVASYLDDLERSISRPFHRREDLALLCEAAYQAEREQDLDAIAFLGKFVVRSLGIMKRIGTDGEGYDRFAGESAKALEEIRARCASLVEELPAGERERFGARYLALAPAALQDLLLLLEDAGRHKNWLIDHPGLSPWPPRISR